MQSAGGAGHSTRPMAGAGAHQVKYPLENTRAGSASRGHRMKSTTAKAQPQRQIHLKALSIAAVLSGPSSEKPAGFGGAEQGQSLWVVRQSQEA